MATYRKTYLCICEGQQEEMYLNHVARLIKRFPQKVVIFKTFVDNPHRLKKRYEEYDSVAIFDHDMKDVEFKRNIEICDELNNKLRPTKRKSGRHIYHAYSSLNFDLWLILHKEDFTRSVINNDAYISDVRRIYGLDFPDNIKNKSVMEKTLSQITLTDVKDAICRAENIRRNKIKTDSTKVGDTLIYSNPDFSIHEFLKVVFKDSGYL